MFYLLLESKSWIRFKTHVGLAISDEIVTEVSVVLEQNLALGPEHLPIVPVFVFEHAHSRGQLERQSERTAHPSHSASCVFFTPVNRSLGTHDVQLTPSRGWARGGGIVFADRRRNLQANSEHIEKFDWEIRMIIKLKNDKEFSESTYKVFSKSSSRIKAIQMNIDL